MYFFLLYALCALYSNETINRFCIQQQAYDAYNSNITYDSKIVVHTIFELYAYRTNAIIIQNHKFTTILYEWRIL